MAYLVHHGVKGQQWGVRNGPPYPIEDKVLKKGTKLNSVSARYISSKDYMNNGNWMYTYRKDEEWDNQVYKGPFAQYLATYRGAQWIKEHQFETIKDLKMPTKNERVSEFKNMLKDPKTKDMVVKDLKKYRNILLMYRIGSQAELDSYMKFNENNIKTSEDYKVAYEIFNHAMEAVHANESTKEYAKRMSLKYDAMVDDNNQGVYNDAHDPIIIFKVDQSMKDVSDPKNPHYLTMKEINDNLEKVRTELSKKGIKVKL